MDKQQAISTLKQYSKLAALFPLAEATKYPPPKKVHGMKIPPEERRVYPRKKVADHLTHGGNYGMVPNPEYVVIDVDAHKSSATWKAAEDFFGIYEFPDTLKVTGRAATSPRSGHYWFRLPDSHDWDRARIKSVLTQGSTKFADIITYRKGYLVGEGSHFFEDGEKLVYECVSNTREIAELPEELYNLLQKPPPTKLTLTKSGKYKKKDKRRAEAAYRNSKFAFRFAREGNRDNTGFGACRDLGKLYAMGCINKKELAQEKYHLNRYAEKNGSAYDTMDPEKISSQVEEGARRVTVDMEGPPDPLDMDSESLFWHSRPQYTAAYLRASKERVHPMTVLMSDLTVLASHLDHRVQLHTPPGSGPICLYSMLVGKPGRGKSSTFKQSYAWGQTLEKLTNPPARPENIKHNDFIKKYNTLPEEYAKMACIPVPTKCAPRTGPALANIFSARIKGNKDEEDGRMVKTAKVRWRVLIHYDEPDDLFSEVGSKHNLHPMLRTAFFSDAIVPHTAQDDGSFNIREGSYTISMVASMLPEHISDVSVWQRNGLFQRFMYTAVDVRDTDMCAEIKENWEALKEESVRKPIAEWPIHRKNLDVKLDKRVIKDIDDMLAWADGGMDSDYPSEDRNRWIAMIHNNDPEGLLAHVVVRVCRVAALLAMYDGHQLDKPGEVTIPWKYYEDAQVVMRHSAWAIGLHIRDSFAEERAKERRTAERAARIETHKQRSIRNSMSAVEWLEDYVSNHGGKVTKREINNNMTKSITPNAGALNQAIAESEKLEITGRPAVVSLKE